MRAVLYCRLPVGIGWPVPAMLLLDGFERDFYGDLITDSRCEFAGIEIAAFHCSHGISANGLFLVHHGVGHGDEVLQSQCDGLCYALDREIAVDSCRLVAFKNNAC